MKLSFLQMELELMVANKSQSSLLQQQQQQLSKESMKEAIRQCSRNLSLDRVARRGKSLFILFNCTISPSTITYTHKYIMDIEKYYTFICYFVCITFNACHFKHVKSIGFDSVLHFVYEFFFLLFIQSFKWSIDLVNLLNEWILLLLRSLWPHLFFNRVDYLLNVIVWVEAQPVEKKNKTKKHSSRLRPTDMLNMLYARNHYQCYTI